MIQPPNVEFSPGAVGRPPLLQLEDGRRLPVAAMVNNLGAGAGMVSGYFAIAVSGLTSPPTRLIWHLAERSAATRSVRFRFENYPGVLAPAPSAAAAPAPRRRPTPAAPKPRKPGKR
jgi:hypothetical protein